MYAMTENKNDRSVLTQIKCGFYSQNKVKEEFGMHSKNTKPGNPQTLVYFSGMRCKVKI
jgi:hypothetical protein